MARERRAFGDEAIQDVAPKEELNATNIQTTDLLPFAEAKANQNTVYFDPKAWSDLAAVSKDIHDTRRVHNAYDFQEDLTDFNIDQEKMQFEYELNAKRIRNIQISDEKQKWAIAVEELKDRALKEENFELYPAIAGLRESYEKNLQKMGNESPYLEENIRTFIDQETLTELPAGLAFDKGKTEKRTEHQLMRVGAVVIADRLQMGMPAYKKNEQGQYVMAGGPKKEWKSIEESMGDYFKFGSQLFDNISTPEDQVKLANSFYNQLLLSEAKMFNRLASTGQMTIGEAQRQIENLISAYVSCDMPWVDKNNENITYNLYLEPETIAAIAQEEASIKSTTSKIHAKAAETYIAYTGGEDLIKGEYSKISYLKRASTTMAKAQEDYEKTLAGLAPAIMSGDVTAQSEANRVHEHYWSYVRPIVAAKSAVSMLRDNRGDLNEASLDIKERIRQAEYAINNGDIQGSLDALVFTNKSGKVVTDLNYPEGDILREIGEQGYQVKDLYYRNVIKALKDFTTNLDAEKLASIDPDYEYAVEGAENALSFSNIIAESKKDGKLVENQMGKAELIGHLKNLREQEKISGGNTYIAPGSTALIKRITQEISNKTLQEKVAYFSSIGNAFIESGAYETLIFSSQGKMTNEEKEAYKMITTFAIMSSSSMSSDLRKKVIDNLIGGKVPNPDLDQANKLLNNKVVGLKGANIEETIEYYLNDYKVPAELRPAFRKAMLNIAVASVAFDDHKQDLEFNASTIYTNLLDSNFDRKTGVFVHSSALANRSVPEVTNTIDLVAKNADNFLWRTGQKKRVNAKLNYQTGNIDFTIDGKPFVATGTYDPLRGSGVVPFSIAAQKPKGVSEDTWKRSTANLVHMSVALAGISDVDNNTKVLEYMNAMHPDVPVSELRNIPITYLAMLNDRELQKEYQLYCENGHTSNIDIINAPLEHKQVLTDAFDHLYMGAIPKLTDENTDPDAPSKLIDFLYTKMHNGRTVSLDIPTDVSLKMEGFPVDTVGQRLNEAGWMMSSGVRDYKPGSKHHLGTQQDHVPKGGMDSLLIPGTTMLDPVKLDNYLNTVIKPDLEVGNVNTILTSYDCLNPKFAAQYPQYQKYRDLKGANGQPLFQYYPNHYDHFHVSYVKKMIDPKTRQEIRPTLEDWEKKAVPTISRCVNKGETSFGYASDTEILALTKMHNNYKPTEWDAKNTGRSLEELSRNKITRSIALIARYQRYKAALGSKDLALMALNGAKFTLVPQQYDKDKVDHRDLSSHIFGSRIWGKAQIKTVKNKNVFNNKINHKEGRPFTAEEAVDIAKRGLSGSVSRGFSNTQGKYKWVLADESTKHYDYYKKYIDKVKRGG